MGFDDHELKKPIIGVANSWNELVPGHFNLNKISEAVKRGISEAGGLGLEFNTIALCDGITMGHSGMRTPLPSREVIADSIELTADAYSFDGLVLITNCDKIEPGMVMGAIRSDLPTIVVTGGPMHSGKYKGKNIDYSDSIESVGKFKRGMISKKELEKIQHSACPGVGSCAGMFTANTMGAAIESMGLSIKGDSTGLANSGKKLRQAVKSGRMILDLIEKNLTVNEIITRESFLNAASVDMALGGSTNSVLHLIAIAEEGEINFQLKDFNEISEKIPHIVDLSPSGPFKLEDLEYAGGIPGVMKQLKKYLNLEVEAVDGKLKNRLKNIRIDHRVIKSINDPVCNRGGIKVLYGNLAPNGCVVKQAAVSNDMMKFKGEAKVYESEEEAVGDIDDEEIKKGDIIVIRYEGPKGGPGMREMLTPTSRISGSELSGKVAIVTDGRFSGATKGAAIGHVSPEAAEGGPIAVVKNGDIIEIDINNGEINICLDKKEIEERINKWNKPEIKINSKVLDRYSVLAKSADKGAVLKNSLDLKQNKA